VRIEGTRQDPLFNAADVGVVLGLGNIHSRLPHIIRGKSINKMRLYDTFYHVICIISILEMDLPAYNIQDTELGSAFEMIRSFAHDGTQFQVRIAGTKQEPLFNAADIGTVLGYTKIRDVVANLPGNMKSSVTADAIGTLGGPDRLYITEPGLYRLVMRSNKPVALQFQDWVFDVLKRLRLDGEVKLKEQIAAKDTEINKMRLYDTFYHVICIISIMEMDLPAYNVQDSEYGTAFDMIRSFAHDGKNFEVRIEGTRQDPLFNAADVGMVLGLGNVRSSLAGLDQDMKAVQILDTPGGQQSMSFLTEPGLYHLVMRSNKPIAKQFQRWVFDVLKRLRLDGEVKLKEQIAAKDTEMKQLQQVIQEKDMELEAGRVPFSNRQPLQSVYVFTNDTYEKINLYKIGETHSGKSIKRIKQQQTKCNQCVYLRRFNY
jgi:prophage antirepressor-like protein